MKYFVEFEFRGLYPYLYWFPVYISAETPDEAEDHATRIQTAIEQNYTLQSRSRAVPIFAGINSARIEEYRRRRAVGTPMVLNVRRWTMRSVQGAPTIPFEQQNSNEIAALQASVTSNPDGSITLATGVEQRFPVHIVSAEKDWGEEFLLINVVMPKNETPKAGGRH